MKIRVRVVNRPETNAENSACKKCMDEYTDALMLRRFAAQKGIEMEKPTLPEINVFKSEPEKKKEDVETKTEEINVDDLPGSILDSLMLRRHPLREKPTKKDYFYDNGILKEIGDKSNQTGPAKKVLDVLKTFGKDVIIYTHDTRYNGDFIRITMDDNNQIVASRDTDNIGLYSFDEFYNNFDCSFLDITNWKLYSTLTPGYEYILGWNDKGFIPRAGKDYFYNFGNMDEIIETLLRPNDLYVLTINDSTDVKTIHVSFNEAANRPLMCKVKD